MTRNWHLGEPEWEDRGVEGGGGYRYLPVINVDNIGDCWTVARVYVDEDDPEMLEDARLIAAAPDLLVACKLAVKWLKELSNDVDAETDLIDVLEAIDKAEGNT